MRLWRILGVAALGGVGFAAGAQTTTSTYTYDALGRLRGASRDDGVSTRIVLDAAGNRTQVTTTGADQVAVNDYSFEDPDVGSGYAYNQGGASTYFGGNAGIAANGSAWGFSAAPDGKQVGFLQSSSSQGGQIILSFAGTVAGRRYQLRFRAQNMPGYPQHSFTVKVNDQQVATVQPARDFQTYYMPVFTATRDIGAVEFDTGTGKDSASGIDDIEIVPV